jgi:hypothetical protein
MGVPIVRRNRLRNRVCDSLSCENVDQARHRYPKAVFSIRKGALRPTYVAMLLYHTIAGQIRSISTRVTANSSLWNASGNVPMPTRISLTTIWKVRRYQQSREGYVHTADSDLTHKFAYDRIKKALSLVDNGPNRLPIKVFDALSNRSVASMDHIYHCSAI